MVKDPWGYLVVRNPETGKEIGRLYNGQKVVVVSHYSATEFAVLYTNTLGETVYGVANGNYLFTYDYHTD